MQGLHGALTLGLGCRCRWTACEGKSADAAVQGLPSMSEACLPAADGSPAEGERAAAGQSAA